jgi:hypothetical protein
MPKNTSQAKSAKVPKRPTKNICKSNVKRRQRKPAKYDFLTEIEI